MMKNGLLDRLIFFNMFRVRKYVYRFVDAYIINKVKHGLSYFYRGLLQLRCCDSFSALDNVIYNSICPFFKIWYSLFFCGQSVGTKHKELNKNQIYAIRSSYGVGGGGCQLLSRFSDL